MWYTVCVSVYDSRFYVFDNRKIISLELEVGKLNKE